MNLHLDLNIGAGKFTVIDIQLMHVKFSIISEKTGFSAIGACAKTLANMV